MNPTNEFDDDDDDDLRRNGEEQWSAERLSRASYKDLGSRAEVEDRFQRHLLSSQSRRASLESLLASGESTTTRDYSLEIDVFDLLEGDPILGHILLRFPSNLMECLEQAIVAAQQQLFQQKKAQGHDVSALMVKGGEKTRVHARLIHLPPTCCKTRLGALQSSDVGKIVQCSGTVVRTTPVCMYESMSRYKCVGKQGCGNEFNVEADLEQRHNALVAPVSCKCQNCKGKSFQKVNSLHTDYQEVTIQESASQLGGAHVPRSLLTKLQHDLCDTCQPGDEVIIVGVLLAHWHQSAVVDADCQVGMALRAHSIRAIQDKSTTAWTNSARADGQALGTEMDEDKFRMEFKAFWSDPRHKESPIAARDFICKAVCPKLYGMAIIKLTLLITLIGGVCQQDKEQNEARGSEVRPHLVDDDADEPEPFQIIQHQHNGQPLTYNKDGTGQSKSSSYGKSVQTRRRGQSHLLLVGDPGTGKSQFLRFAAAICPRSVLTTGVGTTSAGLTCAAVRENGKEFSLEAGALVLADQGVCCIDEFGCIQNEDRCTIHEAMEQQTLSVAKAGIVCKLNCRATIIAVMNPRDCIYDNQASLSRNTGLGTPLLSRFDTIFNLVESSDAERDYNVTKYLLNRAILQGSEAEKPKDIDPMGAPWTMAKLRSYISYVREQYQPEMTDNAALLLERHYEKLRSSQSPTMPVTVRFLESLIRLSQAHARLMCHNQVKLDDAVAVIRVMECTAFAFGGFGGNVESYEDYLYCDPMTIEFSEQPDFVFGDFKAKILRRYGMLASGGTQDAYGASAREDVRSDGWNSVGRDRVGGNGWHEDSYGSDPKRMRQW